MGSFKADQGGVYSVLVAKDPKTAIDRTHSFVLTEPNSIHILWLIPQYFVITASEIMISVTGNSKSELKEKLCMAKKSFNNCITLFDKALG